MAEILVRAIDVPNFVGDTSLGQRTWLAGDLVHAKPDGWNWGRLELFHPDNGNALFVIKLPGVDPASLEFLFQPWVDSLTQAIFGLRKHSLQHGEFSAALKNSISKNGFCTVANLAAAKPFILDRSSGQRLG